MSRRAILHGGFLFPTATLMSRLLVERIHIANVRSLPSGFQINPDIDGFRLNQIVQDGRIKG
jgi:hypothetical protein